MAADGRPGSDERDRVSLTNPDQPLFADAGATKRDLVDYLDAVAMPMIAGLRDRPLSVIRVLRGQDPFMQKNLPKYAPPWIRTVSQWAQASGREVKYALCDDRRTLLWFANQRAIEYHPALIRTGRWDRQTHLILDIDPPAADGSFALAVRAAHLVRQALADAGLAGAGGSDSRPRVAPAANVCLGADLRGGPPPPRRAGAGEAGGKARTGRPPLLASFRAATLRQFMPGMPARSLWVTGTRAGDDP